MPSNTALPLMLPYVEWGPSRTAWFGSDENDVLPHWITTSAGRRCVRMAASTAATPEGQRFFVCELGGDLDPPRNKDGDSDPIGKENGKEKAEEPGASSDSKPPESKRNPPNRRGPLRVSPLYKKQATFVVQSSVHDDRRRNVRRSSMICARPTRILRRARIEVIPDSEAHAATDCVDDSMKPVAIDGESASEEWEKDKKLLINGVKKNKAQILDLAGAGFVYELAGRLQNPTKSASGLRICYCRGIPPRQACVSGKAPHTETQPAFKAQLRYRRAGDRPGPPRDVVDHPRRPGSLGMDPDSVRQLARALTGYRGLYADQPWATRAILDGYNRHVTPALAYKHPSLPSPVPADSKKITGVPQKTAQVPPAEGAVTRFPSRDSPTSSGRCCIDETGHPSWKEK
ncbi:hypothetical protein HYPSUDRAFT_209455 [Hypholoma sublateritium FD-334 SS-4]|uniref:Uncharacterized protein n=1 Tax=Hypholoma sublateritium (strain FD-334 SS-4) TaxID=945553 RepID=A0A0D2NAB4_HYPSF|nr:hypothetical protein HYPSUDRAFT_209455 [Hypholoma sublateritium FD-334 SS-4]